MFILFILIFALICIVIFYFVIFVENADSDKKTYDSSSNQNTYQEKSDASVNVKWDSNHTTYSSENYDKKITNENTETIKKIPDDSLSNIDFSTLEDLLKNKKWEEANKETNKLVFPKFHVSKLPPFSEEDINNISIGLLVKIDELWVLNSEGRFGFSVQKKIWLECGGNPDNPDSYSVMEGWARKVCWNSSEYSSYMPTGSLPNTRTTISNCIFHLFARSDFPCFSSKDVIKVNRAGNLIPSRLYYTVLNGAELMLTYLGKETNGSGMNLYKFRDENSGEYFKLDEAIVNSTTLTPM